MPAPAYQLLEGSEPLLRQGADPQSFCWDEHSVFEWLKNASDMEVFEILGKLFSDRPYILERVQEYEKNLREKSAETSNVNAQHMEKSPTASRPSPSGDFPVPSPKDETKAEEAPAKISVPMVQFSAYVYVADEEEGVAQLDVIRLGDQSRPSQVSWRTKDGAGKAGETYEQASGTVYFGVGDGVEQISVKLLSNDSWSAILDFQVELMADSAVNARLGHYGSKTRVKVVDKDQFPSNSLRISNPLELTSSEAKMNLPIFTLVKEFCLLNYTCNARVRQGTWKQLTLEACKHLYKLLLLFLRVYLLDRILVTDVPESSLWFFHDREESLYFYMAALIVPFGILYVLDYFSLSWGITSTTITWLQSGLLRRYLNYSSAAQTIADPAVISVAFHQDSSALAKDGYRGVIRLFSAFGNLAVLVIFQITAPYAFSKPFRPSAISIVLLLPLVLFLFLYCRSGATKKVLEEESLAKAKTVSEVEHAVKNFRLVSDFNKRGAVVDQFEQHVKAFRTATRHVGQLTFNNRSFCKWLSEFGFAGLEVISGNLSLGLFLCDIQIFQTMEEVTNQIYDIFVEIQMIAPAMYRMVELLNLPTDLHERKKMQDHLREATAYMRERVVKKRADDVRMDLLPITLEDPRPTSLNQIQVQCKGRIVVDQGTYVALVGQVNCGKATRLRSLGGAILPDNFDSMFIPSHLRVLHIVNDPKFFPGTLMENLCFGVAPGDPDGSEERVRLICKLLEMPKDVMDLIEQNDIITNPDVLVIHRPFLGLDKRSVKKISTVLKDFVVRRGIAQDSSSFLSRRPRTCIVSGITPDGLEVADKIYRVTKRVGPLSLRGDLFGHNFAGSGTVSSFTSCGDVLVTEAFAQMCWWLVSDEESA
eukprot:s1218_g15.t1